MCGSLYWTTAPFLQEQLHQLEAGRLAGVVHVLLVGHAQQRDLAPLDRLAAVVEGVGDLADDVGGHRRVDLAGQLDEPRRQAVLAGHPGQIERVDRDAVPAQAGAGIEGLEAERLGLGRLDHLPDVDPHLRVEHLQFIDQGDVDGAVGVLEDLAGLGDLRAGDGHDPDDDLAVEGDGQLQAGRLEAADDLGDGRGRELGVARVLALGAEGQEEVDARFQPAGGEERQDDVAGRARIGRALEDDELAGPQPRGDGLGRVDDVGEVGLAQSVSGVGTQMMMASGSSSRSKSTVASNPALAHLADRSVGDVPDVALAALEPGDLGRVDVEAQDRDPAVAEGPGQRQADIAQADDPDADGRRFDLGQKCLKEWRTSTGSQARSLFCKRELTVVITAHSS